MSETNYWNSDACARAFWDQHHAVPYQELLSDTGDLLDIRPGQHWLDLGCGAGHLTAVIWTKSQGLVEEVIALDCAAENARQIAKLERRLQPSPRAGQIQFVADNFSHGLGQFDDRYFDGIVSGLAISYAESRDPRTGMYTDDAYRRLFAELARVLKPSGQLVFSVNVPHPNFWTIFFRSLHRAHKISKPGKVLLNTLRMQWYGYWLRREALQNRFHFRPVDEIRALLLRSGFEQITDQLSYAEQAYLLCAKKPRDRLPASSRRRASAENAR